MLLSFLNAVIVAVLLACSAVQAFRMPLYESEWSVPGARKGANAAWTDSCPIGSGNEMPPKLQIDRRKFELCADKASLTIGKLLDRKSKDLASVMRTPSRSGCGAPESFASVLHIEL